MAKRRMPNLFRVRIRGLWCIYCGETAECDDHFPPLSAGLRGFLLPACKECNALAGTDHPHNFSARAALVHAKIRNKYKRLVDTPNWSEDELKELGKNLKSSVKSWAGRREALLRRLAWNPFSYLGGLGGGKDLVAIDQDVAQSPGREREGFRRHLDRIYADLGAPQRLSA